MTVFFRNYLINLEVLMINNFSSSIWNLILNYYLKNNLSLRHNICWFSRWRCNVTTPHIAGHMLIHSMEHFRYANCSTNYTNVSLTPNRNIIYSHIRTKCLEYDRRYHQRWTSAPLRCWRKYKDSVACPPSRIKTFSKTSKNTIPPNAYEAIASIV